MIKKYLLFSLALGLFLLAIIGCSSRAKAPQTTPPPPPSDSKTQPTQKPVEINPPQAAPTEAQLPKLSDLESEKPKVGEEQLEKTSINEKEASALFEAALSAYQESQAAWEKGDFDSCLSCLDETYRSILKIKLPSDSPLLQEKNDLRHLVAQRIQEIYATRLVTAGDNHKTIPLVENSYVKREIESFQAGERKSFEETYRISGLYRGMVLEELRNAGLPEELSWLPLIESWFRTRALSRARALGMWQFISSTGYRFGLKRDRWVDERMDPLKSTRAAIKYLTELHGFFGEWTTALAGYNCGEINVQNVIRTQHIDYLDNFWDLYARLPVETARYVPRLIAALLIINNPEKYGFNLPAPEQPLSFEIVGINHPFKLSALSTAMGLEPNMLAFYNPELRQDATPEYEYQLKVPPGYSEKVTELVASMPRWIPPEYLYNFHYVKSGETLGIIAARYRTSVATLMHLNNMRTTLIRPGQRIKIIGGAKSSDGAAPKGNQTQSQVQGRAVAPAYAPGEKVNYTVKEGEYLYLLAQNFKTTIEDIKKDNNLAGDALVPGQNLVIRAGGAEAEAVYKVTDGDTLVSIAQKFGMGLNTLLALNNLSPDSKIYAGQELRVQAKK